MVPRIQDYNLLFGILSCISNIVAEGTKLYIIYYPYYMLLILLAKWSSRKAHKKIISILARCRERCLEGKCVAEAYDVASKIRDKTLRTYEAAKQRDNLVDRITVRLLESEVERWDDLVESLCVGSDPEFRSLVMEIAERI